MLTRQVTTLTALVVGLCAFPSAPVWADDVYDLRDGKEILIERGALVLEQTDRGIRYVRLVRKNEPGEVVPGETTGGCYSCRVAYSPAAEREKLIAEWLRAFPKAEVTDSAGQTTSVFGLGITQCVQAGYFYTSLIGVGSYLEFSGSNGTASFGEISSLSVETDQLITAVLKDKRTVRLKATRYRDYPLIQPCFTAWRGADPTIQGPWVKWSLDVVSTKAIVFR